MAPLKSSLKGPLPGAKDSDGALPSAPGEAVTPGNPPTAEELAELILQGGMFGSGTVLAGSDGIDQMADVLAQLGEPDFVTVMVAASGPPQEGTGVDGFRELLSDWISPYDSFQFEVEDVVGKDDKLVFLARQVAKTRHGGVEVATESASVWWIRDGRVSQVGFYLDRQAGLKAAGVDVPGRPSGD
jgi:ketosteroid isomerase-like protein